MAAITFSSEREESDLIQQMEGIDYDSFSNAAARRKALEASRALSRRLETPVDSVWGMAIQSPALYTALKIALDLDIFNKLDEHDGRPKTTQELAGSADMDVVRRMLRHLAAMYFVKNPAPDSWEQTRQSSALRNVEVYAGIDYLYDISGPALMAIPHYLRKTDYKDPANVMDGSWQFATEPNKSHFEWLAERPEIQRKFSSLMTGFAKQPGSWVDVFPTETIMAGAKPDTPLMVDIGGAEGRDMQSFLAKHPEAAGSLIFQDQAHIIKEAEGQREHGLIPMVHDFFTPQPVKGARVYFLHRIMHDWPDDLGRKILRNIRSAMVPGYSRLLIYEVVLPRMQANRYQSSIDILMMGLLSSRERSEEAWQVLLASAGFRVVKFWQSLAAYEGVVEAEVA